MEPRHGQRLVRLIRGGNRYSAAIVSSTDKAVTVIIRETYQDPSQSGQLSFPTRGIEAARPDITDRVIRRELEQEDALTVNPDIQSLVEKNRKCWRRSRLRMILTMIREMNRHSGQLFDEE